MKKTKALPAIIMLVAGFIDCIFSIIYNLSLWEFTRQLLLVLVIFYLIGCVVEIVVEINFKTMEETEGQEGQGETEEAEEGSTEENDMEEQKEEEKEPFPENLEDVQSGA
jgi:Ran GTPase-activating protein (RanGAP) involved in mRNA processing and transport